VLRVIGGEFRSRKLKSVPGDHVRPTPDRMRESLFSILAPVIEDSVFIDAYAGTGAVGIEAVSRGARKAILIEKDPRALAVLRDNVDTLKLGARVQIVRGQAAKLVRDFPADILFLDPPYPQESEYEQCLLQATRHKLVIAQHATKFALRESYGELRRYRTLRQGDNTLSFFRPAATEFDDQDSSEDSNSA
jgi:16S rRNA (guanine(966)-N(2))-methyltransferase RsmD